MLVRRKNMSSVQIAYKLIFQKKENPQTATLSHLWDCKMVTRTGIESPQRFFEACLNIEKTPKLR